MSKRLLRGVLIAFIGHTALVTGAAAPPDDRLQAYQGFRAAFDAHNYAEALPLASQVVELSRNQFGKEAPELANPLTNLGTTYLRMSQHGLALDTYREALTVLDLQGDATNIKLLRPLQGIGMALRGLGRDDEAIAPLKRAVDITRNREGLYSLAQLPLLKELIGSYMTVRRLEDAGREQQYAFSIAETAYGKTDARLIGPIDDYARWYEATGRYAAARTLHARAVAIADRTGGGGSLLAIDGLRGAARTYRLAFLYGESEEAQPGPTQAFASMSTVQPPTAPASGEGVRILRNAEQRLLAATPAIPLRLGEVQLDLAEWYLVAGLKARALPALRDAWNSLSLAGAQQRLREPAPLTYRPPAIAVARGLEDVDKFDQSDVGLRVNVNADGEATDVVVMNPVPERESAERAVIQAVKRAQFRPAVENGLPIASTDYVLRERVFVRKPKTP